LRQSRRCLPSRGGSDLAITPDTVAELAACGRARWKIENETFNVLKTNGYNLEHNLGAKGGRAWLWTFLRTVKIYSANGRL
jgi:hypothetical protein